MDNDTNSNIVPKKVVLAFVPEYTADPSEPQRIRIVFQGMPGYAETSITADNLDAAEWLCDRFNEGFGHDRKAWVNLKLQSIALDEARSTTFH